VSKTFLIINYASRGLLIVVGLVWVSGFIPQLAYDTNLRMFGLVFILFGFYRLATFYTMRLEQERYERDGDD
jgi:hypothetical protein